MHQQARLERHTPLHRLQRLSTRLAPLSGRLKRAQAARLQDYRQQLARHSATLEAVSPLATLARGYAIVSRRDDGELLRSSRQATVGDAIEARLGTGRLYCTIDEVIDETP